MHMFGFIHNLINFKYNIKHLIMESVFDSSHKLLMWIGVLIITTSLSIIIQSQGNTSIWIYIALVAGVFIFIVGFILLNKREALETEKMKADTMASLSKTLSDLQKCEQNNKIKSITSHLEEKLLKLSVGEKTDVLREDEDVEKIPLNETIIKRRKLEE